MKRIKELRTKNHLSQQALADVLHVTQQSIHKYEHELAVPELDILIHMADFFDTSIDYLVGVTDNPMPCNTYDKTAFSRKELKIIEFYRTLSPKMQELVQEMITEQEKG